MISMKDIAAATGFSIATVSKALNDQDDISAETKEKVRNAAKSMGYYPNSAAKALKTNKTNNIGVLFVDDAQSGLTHDYFSFVLDSFKREIEAKGYDLTFINADQTRSNRMTYLEHCRYRGFDGVMMACVDFEAPEVMELAKSNIPFVAIDYVFDGKNTIISDNKHGMEDLVRYIYDCGHRRIAYIHGYDSAVTRDRVETFRMMCEELGVDVPDEYVREAAYRDTKEAAQLTRELLNMNEPPTCIIYPDDFAAFGGFSEIIDMGYQIPNDISICGYDGIRIGRHFKPQLTTIRQNTAELGIRAARRLIALIENPSEVPNEPEIISGTLFKGSSVGEI